MIAGILFVASLPAAPAGASTSSISILGASSSGAGISVSGVLSLGTDATGPILVGEDPAGDATVSGPGFDLGNATITTDLAQSRLVFSVALRNGDATLNGPPPATGIGWPLTVDGVDFETPWLGAGTAGSNLPPRATAWGSYCRVETDWICDKELATTITKDAVTWTVPFDATEPLIYPGYVIGSGTAYAGTIATFAWPSATPLFDAAPYDVMNKLNGMLVPGRIEFGIAPAGAPLAQVAFSGWSIPSASGGYSGGLPKPATPGAYTVWTRSCFGLADEPTCVHASRPLTV